MADGGAFVVGEEHQDLHLLAALGDQAVVRHVGPCALAQATGRTGDGRPARVAFVVAGDDPLAHAGHALHRLHATDCTHAEVEGLDRAHDLG
ncbi:hypothetical protein D9M71_493710 [compost metagenome]